MADIPLMRERDSIDCISYIAKLEPRIETFALRLYTMTPHVIDKDPKERTLDDYFEKKNVSQPRFVLGTPDFSRENILKKLAESSVHDAVKCYARLRHKDGEHYIPILDLMSNGKSPEVLESFLRHRALRQPHGFLLWSGNDYHFIGSRLLLGKNELLEFVGNALLAEDIVDKRYLGHHLADQIAVGDGLSLRVAAKIPGGGFTAPRVVRFW